MTADCHPGPVEPQPPGVCVLDNLVHGSDQQGCGLGRSAVMITDHVPAVRVPPDHAGRRVAAAVPARGGVEDRGNLILRHQLAILQRRQRGRAKLNWTDRARLAALLSAVPTARREGLLPLVTPDTMLRRHRDIVRRCWAARSRRGKVGRPATRPNVKALIRRLARENPDWGHRRIHGEMAGPRS